MATSRGFWGGWGLVRARRGLGLGLRRLVELLVIDAGLEPGRLLIAGGGGAIGRRVAGSGAPRVGTRTVSTRAAAAAAAAATVMVAIAVAFILPSPFGR